MQAVGKAQPRYVPLIIQSIMALDERAFFSDRPENRSERLSCPRCRRTSEYSVRWVRRIKKDRIPAGADERDRAKFAKLRDHLIRVDDEVVCKACAKRFEIPSMHSLLFVDQLEGLPRDVEEDDLASGSDVGDGTALPPASGTPGASPANTPRAGGRDADRRGPRRMTTPPRGWRG
jgi:hypothetical protein